MASAKFTFWGVRGSMSIPGSTTLRYGGNTTCIEIVSGEDHVILDGGTGIRVLGAEMMRRAPRRAIKSTILLSHLHWDHYIGLPFFKPFYWSRNEFVVAGPRALGVDFGRALNVGISPPYFPVRLSELNAKISLRTIAKRAFHVGNLRIVPLTANHPNGAYGWRIYFPGGCSAVVMTDNEPVGGARELELLEGIWGADVLIHDAQYTSTSYKKRQGWGHSPYTYPVWLAAEAGISRVYLTHFDPDDGDSRLDRTKLEVRKYAKSLKSHVKCDLAREGLSFRL
jgi:phosphoribosyl 1,2-cyclic phosphodiesterase